VKNFIVPFLLLATILFACKKHNGFVISGKITNAGEKYLYFDELKVSSSVPIDSVKLGRDGTFEFKGTIDYPNFYLLRLDEKNFITLLVDTTEKITVQGDAANLSRNYQVEGSAGSVLVQELNKRLTATKHKIDSIRNRMEAFRLSSDPFQKSKWNAELDEIKQNQIRYSMEFVQKHPFSMSSVLALYQKFDDANYVIQDLQSLKVGASALNSIFPNSEHVKALYNNTQRLMQEQRNNKLQEFIAENGTNSPDVTLPNPNGRDIQLSSIKSKVVLIQFWSALNRDSRYQNLALKELYEKYKSRGLEIYQISIDVDRNAWLNAIDEDNLTWINVGDMKGSIVAVNHFNIRAIPANFILDSERRIAAHNLMGPALDQAVGKLLR
jgi:peroxiredoxin